jgi:hypothetical protein
MFITTIYVSIKFEALPEGKEVVITLPDESESENQSGWKRLLTVIEENQIDADITDLAHQHDHYLYGAPKRKD